MILRCYITDRRSLREGTLLNTIAANLAEGVEWIQIREKDLSAGALLELTSAALKLPNPRGSKILVNGRADVGLAAGAAGLHLPGGSPPPLRWRGIVPGGFLIGVSCHTINEVRNAEAEGADYAVFGPVFAPISKPMESPPAGIEGLARACRAVKIPVFGLGGITETNQQSCIQAGAAGIAGISRFQS